MKKYFDKTNFIPSTFDKSQKRQSLVVSCLIILFFFIASFAFMQMLYAFVDVIGSIVSGSTDVAIKDLVRSLPLILIFFMSVWSLLLVHASFRNVSEEKFRKSLFKDGITIICFGVFNILYIIAGLISKIYVSMAEGSPFAIYPLDTFLLSFLFIAIGVMVILYLKKFKESRPYLLPNRGNIVTKARGLYCTFVTFWMLFALFGLAGGLYSMFIYDFRHGYAFFGIAVILCYLLSPIMMGVWEFYYNELLEEKKKEFLLPLALVGLCASILCVALYMISLGTSLDAPSNAGFGMFPVAFAASVNIATLLAVFTPLIVSIVAVIKGILIRKK